MNKNIKVISVVIVVILFFGFVFYWFGWRPTNIRKVCQNQVVNGIKDAFKFIPNRIEAFKWEQESMEHDYESLYKQCLREHGIEK